MKTAIRTPIVEAIRSVIQGGGGGPVSPVPLFYWKGQNTLAATTGTDPTFTRATAATFEDFEGLIKTVESSEPRFQGARRVENRITSSENLLNGWFYTGAGSIDNATTATFNSRFATLGNYQPGPPGTYRSSAKIRRISGDPSLTFDFLVGSVRSGNILPTTEWVTYSAIQTQVGQDPIFGLTTTLTPSVATVIEVKDFQVENVTGQTNQNPSEYVSTGVGTGPELVTNGDFATDSDWTKIGTATISGGQANLATTNDEVQQGFAVAGVTYEVQINWTAGTATYLKAYIGGGYKQITTSGSVTFQTTATGANNFRFIAGNGSATISDISIKSTSHGANVDGVQYFNTLNANTVTANVVTEAVGSPLTRANTQFGELMAAGDYFSTPNVVTTWGELDIRVRATVDSFPNGIVFLADKLNSFWFALQPSGTTQKLFARLYSSGTDPYISSIDFPTSQLGVRNWYRATYDAATGDVEFFTADGNLEAPAISDYVQLGTTQSSGITALSVTTNSFISGSYGQLPTTYPFDGDIYRSQVFNEIDGTTPVVDFDFGDYVSGSTWEGIPYGPELITNGNFATDSDWTKGAGWTISAGSATHTGGVASYLSQDVLTPNSLYKVEIEVLQADGSNFIQIYMGTSPALETITAAGSYTFSLTSQPVDNIGFSIRGIGNAKVDNISVRNIPVFTLEGNASIFQPPVDASGPFGYLAEKASTNLTLQSEDFTTTWTLANVTIAANAAVAPDGTTTMDRVVVDTTNGTHAVYQNGPTITADTNYTYSVYIKDDGAGFGGIRFGGGSNSISVVVNLSTGLVTDTKVGTSSGTIVATGCDDVGNGVYRVWISGSNSPGYGTFAVFASNAALPSWSLGDPTYTGVLGEDILVWGAQSELGTYPTSYIPTTTTAVLRNADVLIAGDMVTDAAGSGYAEASSIWATADNTSYLLSTNSSGRLLAGNSGQADTSIIVYDGTTVATSPTGASFLNRPAPMASTWGDNLTAYKDGSGGTPKAYAGTMGTGSLNIGQRNTLGQQWNGTIREVKIFDSELTAEEVGDL